MGVGSVIEENQMDIGGFEIRTPVENGDPYGPTHRAVTLAMQRLWLTGQILPLGARILVQHTFRNGEDKPLEIVYAFMLPRDAALRRFEVRGDNFEAHSELRKVEEAVAEYEAGIDAGHLSTLARAYRDGMMNLSVGNLKKGDDVTVTLEILAGVEFRDDGLRFRFPFTLAPGYHAHARMIDTDKGGEIELPRADFGDVILPTYKRSPDGLHEVGFDLSLRIPGKIAEVSSPSHGIKYRDDDHGRRVSIATSADSPNRDLVLDVSLAKSDATPQVLAGDKHFGVAIPSTKFGSISEQPRKVAMVIDRSGSMQGLPMTQARKAVEACLAALGQEDSFALVAFDDRAETFRSNLIKATGESRKDAKQWLSTVDARGGTELAGGFGEGARLVAGGGDVLVITDGQVMGTEDIIAQARKLGVRIHCLGIGSASQDRFLAQLASSTGGVSRMVTPQERVDVAAVDLFASIGRPVAAGITVKGAHFGLEVPDAVFGGTPWTAFGEIVSRAAHPGTSAEIDTDRRITINWKGGSLDIDVPRSDEAVGETVALLSGAKQIAELESRMTSPSTQSNQALAEREQSRLERRLEALSTEFGLASRVMALVAVVEREGDRAGELPTTQVVPVGMPQDSQYDAYFGAPAAASAPMQAPTGMPAMYAAAPPPSPMAMPSAARTRGGAPSAGGLFKKLKDVFASKSASTPPPGIYVDLCAMSALELADDADDASFMEGDATIILDETDRLMEIASTLEPDGGVPGGDLDKRAMLTASAVLFFLYEGHTPTDGAFRAHVERMVRFLETVAGLTADHRAIVDQVAAFARAGKKPKSAHAADWAMIEEMVN